MTTQYFHFSLAPVQSFISQARRTRDFWAGSFILSWLSAVAMQAVIEQKGTIEFPKPDDDYLKWLKGEGKNAAPQQGGVPNRFKAGVTDDFKPEEVVNAVNEAWQALASKVYEGDLANAGDRTKTIWDRQVAAFWEMSWVIEDVEDKASSVSPLPNPLPEGEEAKCRFINSSVYITDDITDSSALDVRKNWRSYLPPDEAGVKCMMMDGWQELSGADRPNAGELATFWQGVLKNGKPGIKTDFRENEHLCAIAFIKRRFPRYFQQVQDLKLNGWSLALKNWKVDIGRPSVAYMAAVHWLEQVFELAEHYPDIKAQLWRFHDEVMVLTEGDYNEWDNNIRCIKARNAHKKWQSLDGNVFFESALENVNIYKNQDQAKKVRTELKNLQKLLPDLPPATPFYAVLMMDGDSLGVQMSNRDKQGTITQGLKNFTDNIPKLVAENNGFLIYAGGDDVLAVLPLEDALACALKIRDYYECVFAGLNKLKAVNNQVFTSISAAVIFAPIKMPLMKVLKEAHTLLDKVAKDEYGRDALAVSVWKPGGRVLQWARPWNKAIADDGRQLILERLAKDFADDDKDYGQLSNKFLYKIRERFELLNPPPESDDENSEKKIPVLSQEQAIDLMAAEYISSGLCEDIKEPSKRLTHAQAVVGPLLEQCRPVYRKLDEKTDECSFPASDYVRVDAALLVRFLAQKGVNL
ncbi:type III-B CRISPR-associated protein Cas10/Cmr2 [Methyloglobulus sp.]|uniref:type III-B CRISPR-associated protein Cas10/Cmr2 n=1 Tax=Methyloglobulus sp. TaxID=2518622 RepID=UPI0039898766